MLIRIEPRFLGVGLLFTLTSCGADLPWAFDPSQASDYTIAFIGLVACLVAWWYITWLKRIHHGTTADWSTVGGAWLALSFFFCCSSILWCYAASELHYPLAWLCLLEPPLGIFFGDLKTKLRTRDEETTAVTAAQWIVLCFISYFGGNAMAQMLEANSDILSSSLIHFGWVAGCTIVLAILAFLVGHFAFNLWFLVRRLVQEGRSVLKDKSHLAEQESNRAAGRTESLRYIISKYNLRPNFQHEVQTLVGNAAAVLPAAALTSPQSARLALLPLLHEAEVVAANARVAQEAAENIKASAARYEALRIDAIDWQTDQLVVGNQIRLEQHGNVREWVTKAGNRIERPYLADEQTARDRIAFHWRALGIAAAYFLLDEQAAFLEITQHRKHLAPDEEKVIREIIARLRMQHLAPPIADETIRTPDEAQRLVVSEYRKQFGHNRNIDSTGGGK